MTVAFSPHWRIVDIYVKDLGTAPHTCDNPSLTSSEVSIVRFTRPTYQRSLVWTKKRAKNFKESLEKGYPFGLVVLAYKGVVQESNGIPLAHHHYNIIDGQQRLFWFEKIRLEFFTGGWFVDGEVGEASLATNWQELCDKLLQDAKLTFREVNINKLVAVFKDNGECIKELRTFNDAIRRALDLPHASAPESIEASMNYVAAFRERLIQLRNDFSGLKIPALIIEKRLENDLSTVFRRLNDSVKLSKYESLAATWAYQTVDLTSALAGADQAQGLSAAEAQSLIDISRNRLIEGDIDDGAYEVDFEESNSAELSLYEYLYSLGRLICDKYPVIGQIDNAADQLVLAVTAILFTGDGLKVESLIDCFPMNDSGRVDTKVFPQALLQAAHAIQTPMKPIVDWNWGTASLPKALSMNQVAAYMAAYIANVYEVTPRAIKVRETGGTDSPSTRRSSFQRNLSSWYLHDALETPFKGTPAYANQNARVWAAFNRDERIPNRQMLKSIDVSTLKRSIKTHVIDQSIVTKTPVKRSLTNPGLGALLRLCYKDFSRIEPMDRDHVVPMAKGRVLEKAPLNHFGNWMPLEESINRARQDRFWAECQLLPQVQQHKAQIQDALFMPLSDAGSSHVESVENFIEFLFFRSNQMILHIAQNIGHDDMPPTNDQQARDQWLADFKITKDDRDTILQVNREPT